MGDPSPQDASVRRPGGESRASTKRNLQWLVSCPLASLWEAESPTGAAWLGFSSAPIRPFPKHNSVSENRSVVGVKVEAIRLHGSHIDEMSSSSLTRSKLQLREERENTKISQTVLRLLLVLLPAYKEARLGWVGASNGKELQRKHGCLSLDSYRPHESFVWQHVLETPALRRERGKSP